MQENEKVEYKKEWSAVFVPSKNFINDLNRGLNKEPDLSNETFYADSVTIGGFEFSPKVLEMSLPKKKVDQVKDIWNYAAKAEPPKGTWWAPMSSDCLLRSAVSAGFDGAAPSINDLRVTYETLEGFKDFNRSTQKTAFTVLGEQTGKTIGPLTATGKLHLIEGSKKLHLSLIHI